jgi:hypothetical protein
MFNYKLHEKRDAEKVVIFDFPLEIRRKPTAHKQYCFLCRGLINKGDKQIIMVSGFWHAWGHIYFHIDCFTCLLKKIFQKAELKFESKCESCSLRFNCFTDNIDILNNEISDGLHMKQSYTPSHPCGGLEES